MRVIDEEGVENDPVHAGENLRGKNIQAGGGERPSDLGEQSGAVPGADVNRGVTAIGLVVPHHDWLERFVFLGELQVHEAVRERDVGSNLSRGVDLEIARGKMLEVSLDFLRAEG